MLASPAFARPLWPSVLPPGIRVDVPRGTRARVHALSFDGAAARNSLHVIELLDQLIVVLRDKQDEHSASIRMRKDRRMLDEGRA
jgi:hypothetical protein